MGYTKGWRNCRPCSKITKTDRHRLFSVVDEAGNGAITRRGKDVYFLCHDYELFFRIVN